MTGVIAASFTHFTSRADDPQLHDHVVVWNRASSVSDGKWRTLDSKAIFKATTTLSELHQGVLSDLLTAALGVGWEARGRRHSTKPRYEITGVAESLMAEFSRRSEQIAEHSERLRAEFDAAHGRSATAVEDMRLHAVATIATRPDKTKHSLAELTETWRERAASHVAEDEQTGLGLEPEGPQRPAAASRRRPRRGDPRRCRRGGRHDRRRAPCHLRTPEPSWPRPTACCTGSASPLLTTGWPSPSTSPTSPSPARWCSRRRRCTTHPSATSAPTGPRGFIPKSHVVYTTEALLDAEARLLEAGEEARSAAGERWRRSPRSPRRTCPGGDYRLSLDQALAVEKIATSGRVLDVLVGPAGTGKSTAMAGLRAAWEQVHGPGR